MLFNEIVYGPIRSRRLGISLGINIMPLYEKQCTFDCIYCECGFNPEKALHPTLPTVEEFGIALEKKLQEIKDEGVVPDVITFSGNGEPTMHPCFAEIIDKTIALRDKYCPTAKVSVLSNSTQLGRGDVVSALKKVDNRILKLDSAIDATMHLIDQPLNRQLTVRQIMDWLRQFAGDFTLQTCFLRGMVGEHRVDNTTEEELEAWYKAVEVLRPKQVMIYVIDRATPVKTLEKIEPAKMNAIAEQVREKGINISVS